MALNQGAFTDPGHEIGKKFVLTIQPGRIYLFAYVPFVWPSQYFLTCQFPILASNLALGTLLLFCAL